MTLIFSEKTYTKDMNNIQNQITDNHNFLPTQVISHKPKLLLHICCAPDLSRPLHWLKHYFKLYLFRYNPNIHPKPEHDKRYAEFVKLFGLE